MWSDEKYCITPGIKRPAIFTIRELRAKRIISDKIISFNFEGCKEKAIRHMLLRNIK
jgi:hypothetical protein